MFMFGFIRSRGVCNSGQFVTRFNHQNTHTHTHTHTHTRFILVRDLCLHVIKNVNPIFGKKRNIH
jgi:hypothetical protein